MICYVAALACCGSDCESTAKKMKENCCWGKWITVPMLKLRNLEWRLRGMRGERKHQNNPRTRIISFNLMSVCEWHKIKPAHESDVSPESLMLEPNTHVGNLTLSWFDFLPVSLWGPSFNYKNAYMYYDYMWPKIQWSGPRCWRLSSSGIDCDWILLERALNYDENHVLALPPASDSQKGARQNAAM